MPGDCENGSGYRADGGLDTNNPPGREPLDPVYAGNVQVSAQDLATQLILRAILLKINSPQAHELMKEQVEEQVDALKNLWNNKEKSILANAAEDGVCTQEVALKLEDKIDESFKVLAAGAKEVIAGVFEPPDDVAGLI